MKTGCAVKSGYYTYYTLIEAFTCTSANNLISYMRVCYAFLSFVDGD